MGEGLFPASFVSKNLNVDPEPCKRAELGRVRGIRSGVGSSRGYKERGWVE